MIDNSIEARNKLITQMNSQSLSGDGSHDNPLATTENLIARTEMLLKVIVYAAAFKSKMFFVQSGVIDNEVVKVLVEYDPNTGRYSSVNKEEFFILNVISRDLFKVRRPKR